MKYNECMHACMSCHAVYDMHVFHLYTYAKYNKKYVNNIIESHRVLFNLMYVKSFIPLRKTPSHSSPLALTTGGHPRHPEWLELAKRGAGSFEPLASYVH